AVADDAVDRLADEGGAFLDGEPTGAGLLDYPLRPLETNAEMANGLLELWALTGEERYRTAAVDALAGFAGAYDRMGVEAAGYAAACARAHYDPLVVRTPPAGTDLHRAALRVADHEKVVVPEDREDAVVVRGGETTAPAGTPEELLERAAEEPARDGPS
ncbi:thioredoxin domain-containing protein, partial [Halobacteriales archaeon QH_10_70_21]